MFAQSYFRRVKVISNCAKNYSFEIRQASLEEKKDIIIYLKNKFHQPFFITTATEQPLG